MERDAQFTQRKAERATLRSHFRDKYRLPKVSLGPWAARHIRNHALWAPDPFALLLALQLSGSVIKLTILSLLHSFTVN